MSTSDNEPIIPLEENLNRIGTYDRYGIKQVSSKIPKSFETIDYLLIDNSIRREYLKKVTDIKNKINTFVPEQLRYRTMYDDRFYKESFDEKERSTIDQISKVTDKYYNTQMSLYHWKDQNMLLPFSESGYRDERDRMDEIIHPAGEEPRFVKNKVHQLDENLINPAASTLI